MSYTAKNLLIFCVLLAVVVSLTIATYMAGEPFILGAYSLKPNNMTAPYRAVLLAMGYTNEWVKKIQNGTITVIRVAKDGDKYVVGWTLNLCESIQESEVNTYSGQEYTLTLCDARDVPAKNEWDNEKQRVTRTLKFDRFQCKQAATHISRTGLRVKIRCKNKEADLEFIPLAFTN